MQTIAFFIDPVALNNDPFEKANWVNWCAQYLAQSRKTLKSCLISSPILCDFFKDKFDSCFHLPPSPCLEPYSFSLQAYCRDMTGHSPVQNEFLRTALIHADYIHQPDYLVSWTENRYLREVFGSRCFFSEMGPLPRYFFEPSTFLDPYGHQVGSSLEKYVSEYEPIEFDDDFQGLFEESWLAPIRRWSEGSGCYGWLKSIRKSRPVTLLALQPPNNIAYEGAGADGDEIALIRRVATSIGSDHLLVPMWHSASRPISEEMARDLELSHRNIRIPPSAIRSGKSEAALCGVDQVMAVSSSLLFIAAVCGLAVSPLGSCKFSCLKSDGGSRRLDLLAFATRYYCQLQRTWLEQEGAFFSHISDIARQPSALFISPEPVSAASLQKFVVSA